MIHLYSCAILNTLVLQLKHISIYTLPTLLFSIIITWILHVSTLNVFKCTTTPPVTSLV